MMYDLFLRIALPTVNSVNYLFTSSEKRGSLTVVDKKMVLSLCQNGDVILSKTDGFWSNAFIPGFYKHCAIVVEAGVVEATTKNGVAYTSWEKFLETKDYVCLLRPRFLTAEERIDSARQAFPLIGMPYDFLFQPSCKAFYCSELVEYCYEAAAKCQIPFKKRMIFGTETILPNDFDNAKTKFDLIYRSAMEKS